MYLSRSSGFEVLHNLTFPIPMVKAMKTLKRARLTLVALMQPVSLFHGSCDRIVSSLHLYVSFLVFTSSAVKPHLHEQ